MSFVLPRSREGRKERERRSEKGKLTAVSVSLSAVAVDRLLFHFVTREYFRRWLNLRISIALSRCFLTSKTRFILTQ